MDLQALTSERLPTLPKLDKDQFIHSYIQGQRVHAKSYAEEGRCLASSWDVHRHHSTPNTPPAAVPGIAHNVGFATPVLTARIPRTANEGGAEKGTVASKPVEKPARVDKAQPKPKSKENLAKTAETQKSLSKKRAVDLDSDEDQAAQRRERKRVKRAIVQPKEASEPDTASSQGNAKSKKRTKAKDKKTKVPAGFALMHGFTATNVGKNRLTVKPPTNAGVFKKGKASIKTKIMQKLKGHQNKHFSELGFLNATHKQPVSDSSSASDASVTPVEEIVKPKKKAAAPKPRQEQSLRALTESSQEASELSKVSTPQQALRVESEIWDLESRASEKRRAKMQRESYTNGAGASYIQRSVVMDVRIPAWCGRPAKKLGVESTQHTAEAPDPIFIPSSPSLRPSQSASQVVPVVIKPSRTEEASRYFPAQQPADSPTNL
ncbi:hypothetical protein B0H17DRAFT_274889 [Mycena rosella]|uniref:Uncharacterized protein n=1 Tax=Mycena rosella TaxID=1033263 RepID=A0AAD7DX56_MYCRO|nr:hypothetical protein B0H17DRAFT_274889 [Mycena rosella]